MISKVVEDYMLMQSIGKGQYGNVYRAENNKLGGIYAVKVMSAEKFKHTPKLSQFTNNQINILTKISHPNIIKFIQMLRTTNNYYLVYEYCNGGTLADFIKQHKRLSENQAIRIFLQLRSGFEVLSKQKILHRDLKPTNILFHNGVVKIADFGFCKEMMESDMTQTMVGSPIYMAPEVLKGSIYDNRADIWSLGVILYEMLYGYCPYEESSITKLINLIDNALLKFPPEIPVSNNTKVLLKRMMMIRYRQRISPTEFVKYPIELKDKEPLSPTRSSKTQTTNLKEVIKFHRKNIAYIAESLEAISFKVDDDKYLLAAFLLYKILSSIQKDILKESSYWDKIKIKNNDENWDYVMKQQAKFLEPFGAMIRENLTSNKASPKIQLELDTNYIDFKYYLESINDIDDEEIFHRLINCFLVHRHYMLAFEKNTTDFTDFISSKKTLDQKVTISRKFAFTRHQ